MLKTFSAILLFFSINSFAGVVLEGKYNGVSERDGEHCIVSLQVKHPRNRNNDVTVLTTVSFTNDLFKNKKFKRNSFSHREIIELFDQQIREGLVQFHNDRGETNNTIILSLAENKLPVSAKVLAKKAGSFLSTETEDSDTCINLEKEQTFQETLRIYDL